MHSPALAPRCPVCMTSRIVRKTPGLTSPVSAVTSGGAAGQVDSLRGSVAARLPGLPGRAEARCAAVPWPRSRLFSWLYFGR